MPFGQVAEHDADQQRHADAALQHREPEDEGLGHAVEDRAEHDRERRCRDSCAPSASLRSPPPFLSRYQLPAVNVGRADQRVETDESRPRVDFSASSISSNAIDPISRPAPSAMTTAMNFVLGVVTYAISAPTSSADGADGTPEECLEHGARPTSEVALRAHQVGSTSPTLPRLVEERLQRAVEPEHGKNPLPGMVWIQLPSATPAGCSGPKWTVVEPSAFGTAAGDGIRLAAGARVALRRREHRAGLVVVERERPEPRLGRIRAAASPCTTSRRRSTPCSSRRTRRGTGSRVPVRRMAIAGVMPV